MEVQRENKNERERMWKLEWSEARKRTMEEQAKAELESLQLLHPDRFEYLKLELRSFLQLFQSDPFFHHPKRSPMSPALESQESSSCRKRRKKDRVEEVLERAVGCLQKIRRFKTALFSTAD